MKKNIIGLITVFLFIGCNNKESNLKSELTEIAKREVDKLLKKPSTASFVDDLSTYTKAVNLSKDTIYMINLVVDAENSLGQMTRGNHTVSFTKDSTNGYQFFRVGDVILKDIIWKPQ